MFTIFAEPGMTCCINLFRKWHEMVRQYLAVFVLFSLPLAHAGGTANEPTPVILSSPVMEDDSASEPVIIREDADNSAPLVAQAVVTAPPIVLDYFRQTHAHPVDFRMEYVLWRRKLGGVELAPPEQGLLKKLHDRYHERNLDSQLQIYRRLLAILRQNPDYPVFCEDHIPDWSASAEFRAIKLIFLDFDVDHPTEEEAMEIRRVGADRVLIAQGYLRNVFTTETEWKAWSNQFIEDSPENPADRLLFHRVVNVGRSISAVENIQKVMAEKDLHRAGIILGALHQLNPYVDPNKVEIIDVLGLSDSVVDPLAESLLNGRRMQDFRQFLRWTSDHYRRIYPRMRAAYHFIKGGAIMNPQHAVHETLNYAKSEHDYDSATGSASQTKKREAQENYQKEYDVYNALEETSSFDSFMEHYAKSPTLQPLGCHWDRVQGILVPNSRTTSPWLDRSVQINQDDPLANAETILLETVSKASAAESQPVTSAVASSAEPTRRTDTVVSIRKTRLAYDLAQLVREVAQYDLTKRSDQKDWRQISNYLRGIYSKFREYFGANSNLTRNIVDQELRPLMSPFDQTENEGQAISDIHRSIQETNSFEEFIARFARSKTMQSLNCHWDYQMQGFVTNSREPAR